MGGWRAAAVAVVLSGGGGGVVVVAISHITSGRRDVAAHGLP